MSASNHMYVRFRGVRGSIPVSGPRYAHYGGNTSCVEVRCGEVVLVLDAGSGLRELGAALVEEGCTEADLFLSHTHVDHVLGLPFFPFAFQGGNTLRLWSGHQPAVGTTEGAIRHLMSAPLFPVPPEIFSADVAFLDFRAGETLNPKPGIAIRTAPLRHPGGATGYRIEYEGNSICYVTDTEHEPGARDENVVGLIEGADIVIYDAMFTTASSPVTAAGVIRPERKGRDCAARLESKRTSSSTTHRIATTKRSTGSKRRRAECSRDRWWPAKD